MIFASIFTFALSLGANLTHRDGDLGRHIRIGWQIIDKGRIPDVDLYSYTRPLTEMVPHEWLAQATLAEAERTFGFDGIGYLTALLAALPWFIIHRWLVKRGSPIWLASGLVVLGAAASVIHWASRPHAFTWLFFAIFVVLLEDFRLGKRRHVWLLVPLTLIWANIHGAFIVGFVLIATYLIGLALEGAKEAAESQRSREGHLAVVLAGCFAVALINPAGLAMITNGFSYVGEDFLLRFTHEYNSPDFHNPLTWPFLLMLVLALTTSSVRLSRASFLLMISWTAFALYSFRNIPLYALAMTPILATSIAGREPGRFFAVSGRSKRFDSYALIERTASGGALSLLVLIAAAFGLASSPGSHFEFSPSTFPVDAIEALGNDPPGEHIFNEFHWGGYLEYCCYPTIPVFIDGQTDHYGEALTREYDDATRGRPRWRSIFEKYDVDWVLIPPELGLAQVLTEADDWRLVYRDDTSVVFVSEP